MKAGEEFPFVFKNVTYQMKHNRLDAEEIWPGRDLYRALTATFLLEQ